MVIQGIKMKYKICKFQDDNGKEWYQIKIQWLFLSYYHGDTNYSNYDDWVWNREPNRYSTLYLAQETIKALIHEKKSKKIKLIKCVEI